MFFSRQYPQHAAMVEVIKMASFAWSISLACSKESILTKILIVNPIPPKSPTPSICFQFASLGSAAILALHKSQAVPTIPIVFPSKSPSPIPSPRDEVSPQSISGLKIIAVFTKAKRGRIQNTTNLLSPCSSLSTGVLVAQTAPIVGIAIAVNTPAIVA